MNPDVVGRVIRPTSQEQHEQTWQVTVPLDTLPEDGATVDFPVTHDPGDEIIEVAITFLRT